MVCFTATVTDISTQEKLASLEKQRKENQAEVAKRSAKKAKVEPLEFFKFIDGEVIDLT